MHDAGATNPHKAIGGLERLRRAAGYSLNGLRAAFTGEKAFRQECACAVVMLPAAFWVGTTWTETALLTGSVMLVLIVELLNSSIEAAVDRISLDRHPLAKRAKDVGSAAVFLALVNAAGIWAAALWHRFL
jgi:diacylglycerol kinase (ATP)